MRFLLNLVVSCLFVASVPCLDAQTPAAAPVAAVDSIRLSIESAVDSGDLVGVEASVALIDRALALYPADAMLLHYRGYALYRAGTLVFGRYGSGRARPYFEQAANVLEPLSRGTTIPETHALLSAVYGMQIATSRVPMVAGIRLGSKSNSAMDRALAAAPQNPRAWIIRGIGAFNTPKSFGGGLGNAASYLKKGLTLLDTDAPAAPLPRWGRADAHAWLGQVYAKEDRRDEARAEFQAALALQPRNAWITTVLLPQLDKPR